MLVLVLDMSLATKALQGAKHLGESNGLFLQFCSKESCIMSVEECLDHVSFRTMGNLDRLIITSPDWICDLSASGLREVCTLRGT